MKEKHAREIDAWGWVPLKSGVSLSSRPTQCSVVTEFLILRNSEQFSSKFGTRNCTSETRRCCGGGVYGILLWPQVKAVLCSHFPSISGILLAL
ncbi:hypothetical protein TorRG33x02_145290 [Trema orientale]|uniref:Uncharacterized protein n=1 Tax=Trema orientale TaxID=63057 RepID=A0A2P5EW07_TREOI|nr:hypothetical protein TorRG33x02_145290 [Trema orientale]